jgi:hypothetical protein
MKKSLLCLAGAMAALAFSSCAYDPYYGTSYSVGYGEGYGYGGSSFSTSVFVSTGNPRWGYDPDCHSYYDNYRHCYYDPYLYGYYPVGYRPVVVYGAPHPYGWRPGRSYISPPSRVTNITINNYRDRESAYRSSSYSWAKQVQARPSNYGRPPEPRQSPSIFGGQRSAQRPSSDRYRPSGNSYASRESQSRDPSAAATQQNWSPKTQRESSNRPSRYGQQPVTQSAQQPRQETRSSSYPGASFGGNRQQVQSQSFGGRQQAQPQPSSGRAQAPQRGDRRKSADPEAQ